MTTKKQTTLSRWRRRLLGSGLAGNAADKELKRHTQRDQIIDAATGRKKPRNEAK